MGFLKKEKKSALVEICITETGGVYAGAWFKNQSQRSTFPAAHILIKQKAGCTEIE